MMTRTQKRISGPLLDRIDIRMQVLRVEFAKLRDMHLGESSAEVRKYCSLDEPCHQLMKTVKRQLQLTELAITKCTS